MTNPTLDRIAEKAAEQRQSGVRNWRQVHSIGEELWPEIKSLADHHQTQHPDEGRARARQRAAHELLSIVRPHGNVTHPLTTSKIAQGEPNDTESARNLIETLFPTDWLSKSKEHSTLRFGRYGIYSFARKPILMILSAITLALMALFFLLAWQTSLMFGLSVEQGMVSGALTSVAFLAVWIWANKTTIKKMLQKRNPHQDRPGGEYLQPYRLIAVDEAPSTQAWDWQASTAHEFCHRIENVIPSIVTLEREYLKDRKRRAEPFAITYARPKLPAYNRLWCLPLPRFEVLTTGYEAIMFGYENPDGSLWKEDSDPEHRDFVLGVIACC